MLDAHQLNIFLVAAETLNFTQAAERLHMSQPSISQHIRALEKHFDEKLFIRQGRSLILSDAGRVLIPMAEQFIKQSTRIDEAMSSLKGNIKGRISIGCNAISGGYFLPQFFTNFHHMFPDVTISCQTNLGIQIAFESLRQGNIHFLFTNQSQNIAPCFDVMHILTEEISLITPLDHPWAKRGSIEIKDLLEEKFILPPENSFTYERVNTELVSNNFSLLQLDTFLTLSTSESIAISVGKGLGVSFCSKIVASTIGGVALVPIKNIKLDIDIYTLRDHTQLSTGARDAFWEFMGTVRESVK